MATDTNRAGSGFEIGWRLAMWGTAAGLLSLPFIAMRFFPASGVNWTGSDFAVMGVVLTLCCATVELGAWLSGNLWYRAGFAVAVLAGFLLTWVSLAVGIINELSDPANLMFVGVFGTAILGALGSRFKPEGMVRTLIATAVVQILVGVIALIWGKGIEAIAFGTFLSVLWLASAGLFQKSAQSDSTKSPHPAH
jgi:hypothetical protein